MELLDIIQQVSEFLGLDFGSLLGTATGITVVVNFFKATSPFNKFVNNSKVPYIVSGLALLVSGVSYWGEWLQLVESAAVITILSIGGWSTAKMLFHKAGTQPTNKSGGGK